MLRIEYGPKYRAPATLLGPESPTRRSSRPTSPRRMERYQLQQRNDTIAQLESRQTQQRLMSASHDRALQSDADEVRRDAPTPTAQLTHSPSPSSSSGGSEVDTLSQQLEFDMHLLGQLKQERESIALKFDSIIKQIHEEQRVVGGPNGTGAEAESAAALQRQFGEQLQMYDARIVELQGAISEAAKQMALGYQQQQQQQQPQQGDAEAQRQARRVSFESRTQSHRHRSPSRSPSPTRPSASSAVSSAFPISPLFESSAFDSALPIHLAKSLAAIKATFAQRVAARDEKLLAESEARYRALEADMRQQQSAAESSLREAAQRAAVQEQLIDEMRNELQLTQAVAADSEARRKDLTRLYENVMAERQVRLDAEREIQQQPVVEGPSAAESAAALAAASAAAEARDRENTSTIESLLRKLSAERAKYEDVYSTLLKSKKSLEDQSAGATLQIQSLKAQLTHEKEQNAHERKVMTNAFQAESGEKNLRLSVTEKREKELAEQLAECQAAKNDLAVQVASLTHSANDHRQDGVELKLRVQELTVTSAALQERLDAANSRGTTEHLELLTLRGEQLKWESERDALQARLRDELRNTDGLTRLLEAEMESVSRARDEVTQERESRLECERSREEIMRAVKDKDSSVRTAQDRLAHATTRVSELESRRQEDALEATQQSQKRELLTASLRGDLKAAEHEAALAKESVKHATAVADREAAAATALREQLRATEQQLYDLRGEHESLQTAQTSMDGEVARALRQLKKMAEEKAGFQDEVDQLHARLREAEVKLQHVQRARDEEFDALRQETAHDIAAVRQASTQELESLRQSSSQELSSLRAESTSALERVLQEHREEVASLIAAQEKLQEKLRIAHRLQESMAQAASSFSTIMQQRQTVASPANHTRRSPAKHATNKARSTAASSPPPARAALAVTSASPSLSMSSSVGTSVAPTPSPNSSSASVFTPAPAATAPPHAVTAHSARVPHSEHRSSYRVDPAMSSQLAELRQLRESLANDPLIRPTALSTRRAVSPSRTPASESHARLVPSSIASSPTRPIYSSSLALRTPSRADSDRAPVHSPVRDHSPSPDEFGDETIVLSRQIIPASTITTTITPVRTQKDASRLLM